VNKLRLATVWLGGCSGCHMSFLDLDEWLFELAHRVDLVYSPLADVKEYPDRVDVALVEGAVANEDNLHLIRQVRERTRLVIAFGDCAVTGNVTALRNALGNPETLLHTIYVEHADTAGQMPHAPVSCHGCSTGSIRCIRLFRSMSICRGVRHRLSAFVHCWNRYLPVATSI